MSRSILTVFILPALLLIGSSSHNSAAREKGKSGDAQIETIEKLVVANGSATIELDLNRLSPIGPAADQSDLETLRFTLASDSYFTILATNDVFRTLNPGSIALLPQNAANLPALLSNSLHQLVLEKTPSDSAYDLMVRDSKTGFVFFNATGHHYDYDGATHSFSITDASLLISEEFTKQLGLPKYSRAVVGKVSLRASMSPIEIQTVVNGEVQSLVMPPVRKQNNGEPDVVTSVPGPDVIVGDLPAIQQPSSTSGINGSFVGLGIATTSCNNGQQEFNWFANPNNDHPVIPQNLYRMSGGASNNDRFEQIGQSWLKHAFTALQENACGFGCTPAANGTHLGVGCSDPYSASLNYSQGTGLSQSGLGSRAWVNPFTGFYPRNDSTTPPNNHTGHVHTGTAHRVTVAMSDLIPASNPGATYFGEAQYVTPHEYAWCQAHPGECNMYNNVSYRRFTVATTNNTNFTFATAGSTVRMQPAIKAWTGATVNQFEPAPGVDGIGFLGYKVTNPSPGVWHYEYAVLNQNLDRAVQSFSVPVIAGANISNIGFRAPLQEPGWAADGTVGNTGFSSTPWNTNQAGGSLTWSSETFAQNQNANAIRWGTLYNFRFDSDAAPQTTVATLGFFKTGSPITVAIQAPGVQATPTPTPTLTPTPTPSPTPSPTPTPTPTPSPVISISGNIVYCSNPNLDPVPGVLLTLTGDASGSTSTDVAGNYTLSSIPAGGNYTVTPSVAPLLPGSTGVDTVDVIAVQRHFLNLGTPLSGCKLTAADVNGTAGVDTVDVVAIQRFFLGLTSGVANVGKCQFNPLNRAYSTVVTNQTGQNYDALIFGDVAVGFVYRQEGGNDASAGTLQIAPASPSLPNDTIAAAVTDFIKPVTTTPIEADANLVGFQGDFTFDERVVTFQTEPVQKAGLTSGNWNVSGNVLVGPGPIRTLRVSAYSTDFTPLKGSGTLFELRMTRVSSTPGAVSELVWAAPPHNFIFIDKNLQQLTSLNNAIAPDSIETAKKN